MTAGCTAALRGGILTLTLDTAGSSVNVFTPAVALELERELSAGLSAGARAVVLRSAKPGSFVNGVGLLLAASSHAEGAAMERARTLQRCYERLAAAPVPTIAAIEGNCYGCGLELALTCDYRVARDSYDTHFYMSELRDYAFIPLFGGTQRLTRLLGLDAAMRLLVGERASARSALRMGLVDRLAPLRGVGAVLPTFLDELRRRGWPKRELRRPPRGPLTLDLDALPGPERRLAAECLELARLPLRRGYRLEDGLRAELAGFWGSLGRKESERAMSFFFVRQAAKAHAIGSASYGRPERLSVRIDPRAPALRPLSRLLRARPLPGVSLGGRGDGTRLAFAQSKVDGSVTCSAGWGDGTADCAAFLPFPGEPLPFIELAPRSDLAPWRAGAPLFQLLEQSGFLPVVTRARGRFVAERMLAAFAAALRDLPAAPALDDLLEFGFRIPASLARKLASRRRRAGAALPGRRLVLAERVALALAAETVRALDDGALPHVSQAELLASSLFGFPVSRGGLLQHAAAGRSKVAAEAARVLGRPQSREARLRAT